MKRYFILRVLVLFISCAIISLFFNPSSIFRKKSNTIVLNDKPINISSIENTSSYTEIESTNSFNIDKPFDRSFWINNEDIFLANNYYLDGLDNGVEILNTKTNSSTKIDIKYPSSEYWVSPLGNGFLYGSIEEYANKKFIKGFNEDVYKGMYITYNKFYYYSLLDNTSTTIPEGLRPFKWLPDGSGFIARSSDFLSLVIYDINSKTTHTFLDIASGINVPDILSISISNDGSTYYFSYYDYKSGMFSIYKMSKEEMIPQKIVNDMSIGINIEVLTDNLLLLSNPARNTIFIYDTENHKIYKTLTSNSAEYYISRDKSMLVYVEYLNNSKKLTVINLNDPDLTPTEIFQNTNHIDNIDWSNDNKLAFQVMDYYNNNNVIYTYSFK